MLKTLQLGRALAAISVAAFHLSIAMGSTRYGGEGVFREYTKFGHLGVDFFFVLSGFIILFAHYHDIDKPERWKTYIYRRFVRLYPIYWLYTFLFIGMFLLIGGTDAKIPTTLNDWITSLSLIRFTSVSPPLSAAWTLFHEVAFYSLFSLLILNRKFGLVVFFTWMMVSAFYIQFPTEDLRTPFYVYTAAYNLYFMFGMGAYWLFRRGGSGVLELILGIFCSIAAIFMWTSPHRFLLVFGFTLILAGITKLELSKKINIPIFLTLIGDASYTIYLTHNNVEGTLLKVAMKLNLSEIFGSEATYFIVLLATLLTGYIAYVIVEKPLMNLFKSKLPKKLEVP